MFDIVQKRRWFFLLSATVIVPGLVIMLYSTVTTGAPFRLSIDFLGGSIYELKFDDSGASEDGIRAIFNSIGDDNVIIQQIGAPDEYRWSVRAGFHEVNATNDILQRLARLAPIDRDSFRVETVSATIGQEVTRSALAAVAVGAVVITGFIVIAFRQVPNAVRYGICAIAAMIHDILVVMGVMSLFGLLLGWGDRRPVPDRRSDSSRLFRTGLHRSLRPYPRKHSQAFGRALRDHCQSQHLGDDTPIAGDSTKRLLHHDRDIALRRRDRETVHRHPLHRFAIRHLFPRFSPLCPCWWPGKVVNYHLWAVAGKKKTIRRTNHSLYL